MYLANALCSYFVLQLLVLSQSKCVLVHTGMRVLYIVLSWMMYISEAISLVLLQGVRKSGAVKRTLPF
jgi:hypothetical protein